MFKNNRSVILCGAVTGLAAVVLTLAGNPENMGFCIVCFLRDTAGALGLHRAAAVQYIRPEIIGLMLGSFLISVYKKEFDPRGGSSPVTRFVLGICTAIGALMFLGCPLRMALRLAGGDLNAVPAFIGFAAGIYIGVFFLKRGFSLGRSHKLSRTEGCIAPASQIGLLILLIAAPSFISFTEEGAGPGALHAAVIFSLATGLICGALAQRSRLCMAGGIRDLILFRDPHLISGSASLFAAVLIGNIVIRAFVTGTGFSFGFEGQPVAHTDMFWNFAGMVVVGTASVLLGGCPLRQIILTGEGSTDSAVTLLGILIGTAVSHNFGLAASGKGPTANGKLAVILCMVIILIIAFCNTESFKRQK